MKALSFSAFLLMSLLLSNFSIAQTSVKKETIKVSGNCGICKKTIEKAAKSAGASTASWNEETKELKVTYAAKKTSGTKIQQAVAKSGYDTEDLTADTKAYDNLHSCCKYDRKEAVNNSSEKCCDDATCKKETGDCKDMACCKEKTCCKM
jgi:periplasmic mercuric ion binding protein